MEQASKEMMNELELVKKDKEVPYDFLSEVVGYSESNSAYPKTNIWYNNSKKQDLKKKR